MKKTKRDRLAAAGWKVGSLKEFLGLSAQEEAFIEMKLALAENLRRRRVRRNLTQAQLARLLRSSQSRVAKIEASDPSVSLDLLVRSLLALGLSRREKSHHLQPARYSRTCGKVYTIAAVAAAVRCLGFRARLTTAPPPKRMPYRPG